MNELTLIIALTIYYEATPENHQDRIMVASVIAQRAKDSGHNPVSICFRGKQFSCWNKGYCTIPKDSPAWKHSQQLAKKLPLPLGYSNYHRYDVKPSWSKRARKNQAYEVCGKHLYFKKENL